MSGTDIFPFLANKPEQSKLLFYSTHGKGNAIALHINLNNPNHHLLVQ